jgi:hypothetical protein
MSERIYSPDEAFLFCVSNPGVTLESVSHGFPLIRYNTGDSFVSLQSKDGEWSPQYAPLKMNYRLHVKRYTGLEALILSAQAAQEGKIRKFRGESHSADSWISLIGVMCLDCEINSVGNIGFAMGGGLYTEVTE